jgi:hypothetical protein
MAERAGRHGEDGDDRRLLGRRDQAVRPVRPVAPLALRRRRGLREQPEGPRRTVVFAGYSDNSAGVTGNDLQQQNRTFFVKLGCAWAF